MGIQKCALGGRGLTAHDGRERRRVLELVVHKGRLQRARKFQEPLVVARRVVPNIAVQDDLMQQGDVSTEYSKTLATVACG